MKTLQLHELNKQQKTDIEDLVRKCLKADGLERTLYLDNDINFYINLDSFYLIYDKLTLISVLTILQPLEEEAEITAYTLPSQRKKGYFTSLLDRALKELLRFGLSRILFVVEPNSHSGIAALNACKARYFKSEYLLFFPIDEKKQSEQETIIKLIEVTKDKRDEAASLGSEIFGTDIEETQDVIGLAMNSQCMKCYGAYLKDNLIGICNVSYGADHASIFGFGIAPICQGRGYGRMLLNQVMNIINKKGIQSITLHVGSENTKAFSLYTSVGFLIQTQYDYYEYIIESRE